jgi:phosphatidate cytidylyltransferase
MLKQRVLTAIPLAATVFGVIILLETRFVAYLFALILLFSVLELGTLAGFKERAIRWILALVTVVAFLLVWPSIDPTLMSYQAIFGLMLWGAILGYLLRYRFSGLWVWQQRTVAGLLSLVSIWICVQGLVFIHGYIEQGGWLLMYLLTLVWVADIGAYFSGRQFGRHKLAPAISPGKTWEGVAGGLSLNIIWISLVYQLNGGWGLDYTSFLVLGLITAGLSIVGDLFESVLKREAGLKDSGRLLPGHGGVLDRIDSVIAATPVYLAGLFYLGAV